MVRNKEIITPVVRENALVFGEHFSTRGFVAGRYEDQ